LRKTAPKQSFFVSAEESQDFGWGFIKFKSG
jgi:hypothetical protein